MRLTPSSSLCLALLIACGSSSDPVKDAGHPGQGDGDHAGDGDTSGHGDGDTSHGDGDKQPGDGDKTPGDGDKTGDGDSTPGDGDTTPGDGDKGGDGDTQPATAVRFIVLGDGGSPGTQLTNVASAVNKVCAQKGCEFALYAGDNMYESGVSSATDGAFKTKFEDPWAAVAFPFYVALGNHDYGASGSLLVFDDKQASYEVEYTGHSEKWKMPDYYYTFSKGDVQFFAIDTSSLALDKFRPVKEQEAWLDGEMAKSTAKWKIVFGHHLYISNGEHGSNEYQTVTNFVEASVCGKAQIMFSGHDHNREWLKPKCGTNFIVSGAAAKLRAVTSSDEPTNWNDGTKGGFLWVEIAGDTMTGEFYDETGKLDYSDHISL